MTAAASPSTRGGGTVVVAAVVGVDEVDGAGSAAAGAAS